VDVCPVECIYEYKGDDREAFPNQLYIQPEECIDCGACEPECPWEAIYEDASVPEIFEEDTALNAKMMEVQDDFEVPVHDDIEQPTPEQVEENKKKWGFGG
jgi:ferredoxin